MSSLSILVTENITAQTPATHILWERLQISELQLSQTTLQT